MSLMFFDGSLLVSVDAFCSCMFKIVGWFFAGSRGGFLLGDMVVVVWEEVLLGDGIGLMVEMGCRLGYKKVVWGGC